MGRPYSRPGNVGAKASVCKDRNRDGRGCPSKFKSSKRWEEESTQQRTCRGIVSGGTMYQHR